MRCWDAVTKITLKKDKSSDNITYSRAAFAFVKALDEDQRAEAKAMAETIKAPTRTLPVIDDAHYTTTDEAPTDASVFPTVRDADQQSQHYH